MRRRERKKQEERRKNCNKKLTSSAFFSSLSRSSLALLNNHVSHALREAADGWAADGWAADGWAADGSRENLGSSHLEELQKQTESELRSLKLS